MYGQNVNLNPSMMSDEQMRQYSSFRVDLHRSILDLCGSNLDLHRSNLTSRLDLSRSNLDLHGSKLKYENLEGLFDLIAERKTSKAVPYTFSNSKQSLKLGD